MTFVSLYKISYCIAAMLRNGISALALNSTPAQRVSLRFSHHVTLVHLVPKHKILDCWSPFSENRLSVLTVFWELWSSSSAELLNVSNISKCCERAVLSCQRQELGRSNPTTWRSKLKTDDAVASVTVGESNQYQRSSFLLAEYESSLTNKA